MNLQVNEPKRRPGQPLCQDPWTLDHEWDGLVRHREYPELPLDNNTAERGLRNPVVGHKNYYGSGSVASAELAGRAWTITATAAPRRPQPAALPHRLPRRLRRRRRQTARQQGTRCLPTLGGHRRRPHPLARPGWTPPVSLPALV